jgi:hypothetical protein
MFGPVIVSLVGVSFPVVAGILLAPRQDSERGKAMLMRQCRGYLQSLAATTKIHLKQLPAGLESSSTLTTG